MINEGSWLEMNGFSGDKTGSGAECPWTCRLSERISFSLSHDPNKQLGVNSFGHMSRLESHFLSLSVSPESFKIVQVDNMLFLSGKQDSESEKNPVCLS
jgi:hypothetical protein